MNLTGVYVCVRVCIHTCVCSYKCMFALEVYTSIMVIFVLHHALLALEKMRCLYSTSVVDIFSVFCYSRSGAFKRMVSEENKPYRIQRRAITKVGKLCINSIETSKKRLLVVSIFSHSWYFYYFLLSLSSSCRL